MRSYLKTTFLIIPLLSILVTGAWAGPADQSAGGDKPVLQGPQAVFAETKYEFEALFEGEDVTHDFVLENRGDAPLVIKNVKPG